MSHGGGSDAGANAGAAGAGRAGCSPAGSPPGPTSPRLLVQRGARASRAQLLLTQTVLAAF